MGRGGKRVTLVTRMLAGYMLLVLIPTLIVGTAFMARTRESYERMREADLYSALRASSDSIEHNLKILEENYAFVQNHAKFTAFLEEGPYGVIDQLTGYLEEFRLLLNYLQYSSTYITSASILTDRNEIVSMNGVVRWEEGVLDELGQRDYSGFWELQVDESGDSALIYRRVIHDGRLNPLAIFRIECDTKLIADSIAFDNGDMHPVLCVNGVNWLLEEETLVPWPGEADISVPIRLLGIEVGISGNRQWADELQSAQYASLMLTLALCVLSTAAYFLIVLGLSRRLRRFAMHIAGSTVPRIYEDDSKDELGTLVSAYNSMIRNNQEMRRQVEIEQLRQRETAWLALQAQINPHFLYNTLETARMSAEVGDARAATDILCALGSQLRYAMTADNGHVKLRDEVNHACKYLSTQQYRMEDRLFCEIDVQPEALNCGCPKFIVQPLVENAVLHGIAPRPEGGTVQVLGWMESVWCVLKVSDDGVGVSPEELQKLRRMCTDGRQETTGDSIGLQNVCGRMHYIYGDGFDVKIESPESGGFSVTLRWREDVRRCG